MNEDILAQMAQKAIAWVPTFVPVYFQRQSPHYCGWNSETVAKLDSILNNHNRMLNLACNWGVPIMAGSDGGSYGVKHGDGLMMELQLMRQAGLSEEQVLKSVTNNPRKHFNLPVNNVKVGCVADYKSFAQSPCVDSYKCDLYRKK
jgi:imidazolonepropionase-like amidohydrolase